ncbi:MAG: competence/damage-inducible protein A [Lachnospiraceae bacterium]|nr:competence/damage-inducible protein A [Lachnospiraceae bacterium]
MSESKVVEIICVGTEILLGNIVNTNAAYLAEKCAQLGLVNYYQISVGDNRERLTECIKTALSRSDIVILSGGLGPTEDDLTKETAAEVAGKSMYLHEESKRKIEEYFAKKGLEFTENNIKQALIPEGAIILDNPNGTAPGVIIPYENKHIVLLPGPPIELKPMFENKVIPFVRTLVPGVILSQTVKICSVGESVLETRIKDLIDNQTNPTIATYAKTGEVHVRVTAKAENEAEAHKLIKPMVNELKKRFGNNIYTTDENVSLEQSLVDLLKASELRITTVESCTGGMVASRIINVPGCSEVIKAGYVTYSDKAKRKLVGVKKSTIDKYGAVSAETAVEMAKVPEMGPRADIVVAVTGFAGPDDTPEEPRGLVYIACNVCGNVKVKECHFRGSRQKIRESATTEALVLARMCLLDYFNEKTFKE